MEFTINDQVDFEWSISSLLGKDVNETSASQIESDQLHDLQCQLLRQCINDVKVNSKRYHIEFMMHIINTGSLRDIEKITYMSNTKARRIFLERRRGTFKNPDALLRAGVSRSCVQRLLRHNT
jgi:hypothetical protein